MVKAPRVRHSKGGRQPVTIDLDAGDVTRVKQEAEQSEGASAAGAGKMTDEEASTPEMPPRRDEKTTESPAGEEEWVSAHQQSTTPKSSATVVPPAPPASDHSRGTGIGVSLGTGLAGGIIALLIAGGLQWAGVIPGMGKGAVDQQLNALDGEIASLKKDLTVAKSASAAGDLTELKQAMAEADQKIANQQATIDQIKGTLAKAGAATASSGNMAAQLKNVETRLGKVEAVAKTNADDQSALSGVTGKLDSQGKALEAADQTLSGQADRIGKLEQSLGDLTKRVAAQAGQPKVAMAIAASALKSAVDRGTPFSSELDTYAAIAPKSPEIDALRQYAASGVPTREAIVAGIGPAADAMVAAAQPASNDKGIWDNLVDSARSLVKIRPVGEVPGKGVGATVARMEVDIKAGDFAKALKEYGTLPDNVKAAAATYVDKLKTRLQAEDLVQKALASALKAG
jgi:hypothetical protein